MTTTRRALAVFLSSFAFTVSEANAAPNFISGSISAFTSVSVAAGSPSPRILVRISGGVPDNCVGTLYGWLLIPEANKALMATALLAKATNKPVTVYTNGLIGGYCNVIQVEL